MMSPAGHHRDGHGGFALIEVMLALMLIAVLAALALPGLARPTGPAALRVAAFEISALLRGDRNLAQRTGRSVDTTVDSNTSRILSNTSSAWVDMPPGTTAQLVGVAGARIRFFPDGRSSGGSIFIASTAARYAVDVTRETGAIRVRDR